MKWKESALQIEVHLRKSPGAPVFRQGRSGKEEDKAAQGEQQFIAHTGGIRLVQHIAEEGDCVGCDHHQGDPGKDGNGSQEKGFAGFVDIPIV